MGVKEISSGKKPKKLKLKKTDSDGPKPSKKIKIAPGIPADEDAKVTHSKPVKKSKKTRVSNENDVADSDTVVESTKRKSGKKRKREQEEPSAGGDNDVSGSPGEAVKQKPGKKQKKTRTKDGEDAAEPDAVNDAAEESTAAPFSGKKTQTRSKKGENPLKPKDPEEEKRTVFVGNLPLKTGRHNLRKFFMPFGQVESVRLRSAPRLDAKKPIRMAVITHRFSKDRLSLNGYVRFASEAGAEKAAAEANGQLFMEHRLRVDMALADARPDPRCAIFVGGLPLNVEDDQLWTRFAECGKIISVRVVRDRQTSVGKGIGYVNFADEEAVPRALKLNGSELERRMMRVQRCHATAHPKVDRLTGKKLRKPRPAGGQGDGKTQDNKLAPVNKFSGDATAESKSSLKKKGHKKERWDDAKRQKRGLAQSLSKTIAPAAAAKPTAAPTLTVGGVTPQNKKIKFDFGEDDGAPSEKKKDSEKLKEIKLKKEAKRKRKAKESEAKKKKSIVEPLTNILPS